MTQIYQYAVAPLYIEAVVMFFYFQKKSLPTFQNIVFLIILSVITLATIVELGAGYMEAHVAEVSLNTLWVVECTYFTLNISFGLLFSIYIFSAFDIYGKWTRRTIRLLQVSMLLPYFINIALIWLTPLLKNVYVLIFSIDPVNGYQRGNNLWFYLLCITKAFYILLTFTVAIYFHSVIPQSKMQILYFYVVTISATALIQLFRYGLLIESFGMSLVTLVYFFFIQKPEELLDTSTYTLNQAALLRTLRYNIGLCKKFSAIAIYVDDTMFIANTFGINQMNNFLTDVGTFLKQKFSYSNVFSLQQGCFCIILKDYDERKLNEVISTLNQRFQKAWERDNVELKLYIRLCIINCPADANSSEEILDIINMISTDERYRQSVVFASEIDLKYRRRTIYI